MKTITYNLKKTLLFGLLSVSIGLFKNLISFQFDSQGWFVLIIVFGIGSNFICSFLSSFITEIITNKILKTNLIISLLKALIYSIIYGIIYYLFTIFISQNPYYNSNFFNSILHFINVGIYEGFLFALFIIHYSKSKNVSSK